MLTVIFTVWFLNQQHHLESCYNCSFSGPIQIYWIRNSGNRAQHATKLSRWFGALWGLRSIAFRADWTFPVSLLQDQDLSHGKIYPHHQCTHGYWWFVRMMMTCNTNQEPSLSGTSYGMSGRELWFFIYLGFKVFNIMDLMDLTPHKLVLCRFGTKGNFYHLKKASKQLFFQ